jgi:hypothetical protein
MSRYLTTKDNKTFLIRNIGSFSFDDENITFLSEKGQERYYILGMELESWRTNLPLYKSNVTVDDDTWKQLNVYSSNQYGYSGFSLRVHTSCRDVLNEFFTKVKADYKQRCIVQKRIQIHDDLIITWEANTVNFTKYSINIRGVQIDDLVKLITDSEIIFYNHQYSFVFQQKRGTINVNSSDSNTFWCQIHDGMWNDLVAIFKIEE